MAMRQPQADQRIVFAGVLFACALASVPLMFKRFRENENKLANMRDGKQKICRGLRDIFVSCLGSSLFD